MFHHPWPRYFLKLRLLLLFIVEVLTLPLPIDVPLPLIPVADLWSISVVAFLILHPPIHPIHNALGFHQKESNRLHLAQ